MKIQRTVSLIFLTVSFLSCLLSPVHAQWSPAFVKDSLDQYVAREMRTWDIPGMAICIVKDGKVVVMKGYGVKELGKSSLVDEETLFQIASNSKAFTATSIAMLDYDKRLSFDDKVSKWMPWFQLKDPLASSSCTIRDLLCHRLGFQTFQGDFLHWGSTLSRRELIEHMKNLQPIYPFRYKYGYCNVAFLTAGEIIPLVTDTSWDDFLRYRFFNPLKMSRTSTTWKAIIDDKNASAAHTKDALGRLQVIPTVNVDNLGPAASINSCVKDMSNWMLMHLDSGKFEGKSIVPYKALQQVYTPQMLENRISSLLPSQHFSAYAMGFETVDYCGRKVISHTGGSNGFVTMVCMVPEEKLGITVLTNSDVNSAFYGTVYQVLDAYFNQPYRDLNALLWNRTKAGNEADVAEYKEQLTQAKKAPAPIVPMGEFCGSYHNEVYGKMEILLDKNELVLHFEHHPDLIGKLAYLGDNKFICTYSDPTYGAKVIPFVFTGGKVTKCTVTVNDFIDYMSYDFVKED